eukprot:gene3259-12499_t
MLAQPVPGRPAPSSRQHCFLDASPRRTDAARRQRGAGRAPAGAYAAERAIAPCCNAVAAGLGGAIYGCMLGLGGRSGGGRRRRAAALPILYRHRCDAAHCARARRRGDGISGHRRERLEAGGGDVPVVLVLPRAGVGAAAGS